MSVAEGSVVRLKSEKDVQMTVYYVGKGDRSEDIASVIYFYGEKLIRASIPVVALEEVKCT